MVVKSYNFDIISVEIHIMSKKFVDTWKHRQTSAPRRDYALPHRERSHGYPDWISHMPRIPPESRKDGRDTLMHLTERRRSPPFEAQSYAQQLRQHEYSHRSRSPYFRERQPYLR